MNIMKTLERILTPIFFFKRKVLYYLRFIFYNIFPDKLEKRKRNSDNRPNICDICDEHVENKMCAETNKTIRFGKYDLPLKGHQECLSFYNPKAILHVKTYIRGHNILTEEYIMQYNGIFYRTNDGHKIDAKYWSRKILRKKVIE